MYLVTGMPALSDSRGEKNSPLFALWSSLPGRYDKSTLRVRDLPVAGWRIYLEFERWRVSCPRCGGVHVEHLDWLAKNPRYTRRFAMHVGKLPRHAEQGRRRDGAPASQHSEGSG